MSDRVLARLDALAALTPGRIDRPGYSAAEDRAHALVAAWAHEEGLAVRSDAAGNLVAERAGHGPGRVWTGSHLDTVPDGGRFDGALGIVAGLEAVGALPAGGATVGVVAFRDEEGSRFGAGCTGSRLACGLLDPGETLAADADGVTLAAELQRRGLAPPAAGDLPPDLRAFVETHIEQGPQLALRGAPLAAVDGIVARARLRFTFEGHADHAGTTPLGLRADAGCAAARLVLEARRAALAADGAVLTAGALTLRPGVVNVVPGLAVVDLDARAPSDAALDALLADLRVRGRHAASAEGCALTVEVLAREPAAVFGGRAAAAVEQAVGPGAPRLTSGAGHDAAFLAAAGIDTAMIFVRSGARGASHSPAETTRADDVGAAVAALTAALSELT